MSRLRPVTALSLAISCLLFPFYRPPIPVRAENDFRWQKMDIPAEGSAGNWALARGSDVRCLTRAADGTLYAAVDPAGTSNRLFKSADNGVTWSYTGDVTASVVDIAAAPDDPAAVYYATASGVFRSADAGLTGRAFPPAPGGAGGGNIEITAIDVAPGASGRIIVVATRDKDAGEFGGIYAINESEPFAWQDTYIGPFDVYAVAFSPNYYLDRQVAAVVNNEADTFVTVRTGAGGWGATMDNARLTCDSASPSSLPTVAGAALAFPDDYLAGTASGTVFFAAVDTGTGSGDAYRISVPLSSGPVKATGLNAGGADGTRSVDIGCLAAVGGMPGATLLAGSASDSRVFASRDGGKNWTVSDKAPAGDAVTGIVMPPDFAAAGVAYAATSGTESAFSLTRDYGLNWDQRSLIDTFINPTGIMRIAPSPDYAADGTIFLLAAGTRFHVFRSTNRGAAWEQVMSSALPGVESIELLCLSPNFGKGSRVVYLAGTGGGSPAVWRSADGGMAWDRFTAPFAVDVMAAIDDNRVIIGGTQGSDIYIMTSDNGGYVWENKTACGGQSLKSLALSPDYAEDRTILAGNSDGWCYLSTDGGATFRPLPADAAAHPLSGGVSVAFDPDFAGNRIVYAASDTANAGVYRFTVGKSQSWERLDSSLPEDGAISQITVSATGALYATNSKADTGIERSVNPSNSSGAVFETFTAGLPAGARLAVLAASGNRLFAGDTGTGSLLTLEDTLTQAPALLSPADKAPGIGMLVDHEVRGVNLDWESIPGATSYEWQLTPGSDFTSLAAGFSGETQGSDVHLPALEPAAGYRWRVRASGPALSPWSDTRTFATGLGEAVTAPVLKYPPAGANDIPQRPVFQWDAVAAADGYELVVAPDPGLAGPAVNMTVPGTAWESGASLEYGKVYYWKVRAVNKTTQSAWSNTGAFRVAERPLPTSSAVPQITGNEYASPAPDIQPSGNTGEMPSWAIYLIIAVVACLILLTVTVILLVRKLYFQDRR